jgi:2-keto-4-pentenoate hydratase/2-oxohepta-3-ene-1,7-dioic acid hydratase in catechol pathway
MKLATLVIDDTTVVAVCGPGQQLLDAGLLLGRPTLTMAELIEQSATLLGELESRVRDADLRRCAIDGLDVAWRAPVPRPSKIVGVAVNNEMLREWAYRPPPEPAYFLTPPSALVGHLEPIVVKPDYGLTHPEPELAAVIGRRASCVAPEEALDIVFGFSVLNDVTSPALKSRDSMEIVPPPSIAPDLSWREERGPEDRSMYLTYHSRSKGCDTFAPMGPWIVTRDDVADPNRLEVRGWLGDEQVLVDSTAHLAFSVEHVLSHLSHYMTLEEGDVVHFGTAARTTSPRFPSLWSLDLAREPGPMAIEIEGIGRLENPVLTPDAADAALRGGAAPART